MRVGLGFDVHRFAKNRALVLGGVTIPSDVGLEGHSDADVLIHALMDALLGALALGDIGDHFPDTDPKYQGISSLLLLEHVMVLLQEYGYVVGNVDLMVMAQKPRLAPYKAQMIAKLAQAMRVEPSCVSIKATTMEHLGFVGREEGIVAQAVALLEPINR
nr:2-C-methyl-D-erythritol 2,4-cyclodiphosphate synthase [Bacilli bacterium]